ncbi:hypothetical protein ACQ4PT_023667 [Festuca glaucescens]
MESTVLSVGKSVLNGALSYAKSVVAEEVALQLGVRRDQFFITNELEMMQAFLMVAHDEGDNNTEVIKVWVKQVRDVAYDVEDSLLDLAVRLEKQSWWRIGRTLFDRRDVAKQMKQLRSNVEDVSQRNLRYNLIRSSKSTEKSAAIAGATAIMSGTDEARRQRDEATSILVRLICDNKDACLKVISVWGKGCTGDLAHIVKRAHEYIKIQNKFECQAYIGFVRPFILIEFLQDVVQQFYTNSLQGADELEENASDRAQILKMMGVSNAEDLARELKKYLTEKSYLIVLTDINTIEEWKRVKTCFPDNKKASRIIVSTEQVGVASLCVGAENGAPQHKQLFADQTLHVFYKEGSHDGTYSVEAARSSSKVNNTAKDNNTSNRKMFDRTQTRLNAIRETELIGREKEKTDIIKLITNEDGRQERELLDIDGFNRRDACTFACCAVIPCIIKKLNHGGVMLPRGIRKLKALNTLRDVDLPSGDNAILHDIKRLTGLRKLGLMSITKENSPDVFSVISHLSHLQSLMLKSYAGFLYLSDTSLPPKNLHSLKLLSTMEKLPGWITELHNLVKLKLSLQLSGQPEHDAAIQVLGNLPNLSFLYLQASSSTGTGLHFKSETFGSLGVLELGSLLGTESVRFEQGAMPKLEQLKYWGSRRDETIFSGLEFLSSIKKVVVDLEFIPDSNRRHGVVERVKKQIQDQLALNTNADKIILKMEVKVNTL